MNDNELRARLNAINDTLDGVRVFHQECHICKMQGHKVDMIYFDYKYYHKECYDKGVKCTKP
jgi:hypothetical protein